MSARAASDDLVAVRTAIDTALADLVPGGTVLVACSGGPDSLALAGAAAWVGVRRRLTVRAVVVDHDLQLGSADVAARAADTCRALGIAQAEVVRVRVGREGGPEAAARAARYVALEQAADQCSASAVLLGHTRDDQAETVLLRLTRGSGARSLSSMRPRIGLWRRPLLALSRSSVHAAAAELLDPLGASPWIDPHNSDRGFARVRVRTLLEDLTTELGPGPVLGLTRSAELLADDADALDAIAEQAAGSLVVDEGAASWVECSALAEHPRAVRTRVIRLMGLRRGCPADQLDLEHIRRIEALISDWRGQGEISLPGGVVAARSYGRLWVRAVLN